MALAKPKEEIVEENKTTKQKIDETFTDELIIGICSPIGSTRKPVIEALIGRLKKYNYEVEIIRLSEFIDNYYNKKIELEQGNSKHFSELMHKIKGGDFLRKEYHSNSILVELAIHKIRLDRNEVDPVNIKGRRKCYIIDSLKNIDELILLRTVYREIFYLFSIYSPDKERKQNLIKDNLNPSEAEKLIMTDEFENILHGQNVRNTFVQADFFIRYSKKTKVDIRKKIEKYIHLIFDSDICTPNYFETAMYNAKSASVNSACLSRQVGAAITDEKGNTIALGWNDAPKYGGNLCKDSDQNKCSDLGCCSNVSRKEQVFSEIKSEIKTFLDEGIIGFTNEQKLVISNKLSEIIIKSKFNDVIEYSRAIHAEMHAIIIGSQLTGNKMVNGLLFCTTYPCHACARHIVLAGIKTVYYIEPYKKSLSIVLHNDAITEDEDNKDKVRLLLYDGVAPRRYLNFFTAKDKRKDSTGNKIKVDLKTTIPKDRLSLQAIPTLEGQAIIALEKMGLIEGINDEEEAKSTKK